MKKIFLFSYDPGGTNAVFPLVEKLKLLYSVEVYAGGAAVDIYRRENILLKQEIISDEYEKLEELVRLSSPDLIITGTSSNVFCEKYLWKIGERLQIPTLAILDHWCCYGIRFSRYRALDQDKYTSACSRDFLPDKILVMDDFAKEGMIADHIPAERIVVTGQPHFEWIINKKEQVKQVKRLEEDTIRILYVSDVIEQVYGGKEKAIAAFGYSEKTIFEALLKSVERLSHDLDKKIEIVIKLHPKELRNSYDEYIKESSIKISYERYENIWEFLPHIDVVCGSISMLLVESYIYGKNVISIQIGDTFKHKFILEELGKIECVRTEKELDKKIADCILQEAEVDDIYFKVDACNNILKLVEEII